MLGTSPFATLHNTINRATGTTTGVEENTGGLYPATGEWCARRTLYLRVAAESRVPWQALLYELTHTGFGKRRSVGYGAVRSVGIDPFDGFEGPEDADGFVTLSAFVPAEDDPTIGFWKTGVKYGKVGEERGATAPPFKRPLVRLLPGAVFRTDGRPGPFYGRLIDAIVPAMEEVRQYAFAFAVPLRWPTDPASVL